MIKKLLLLLTFSYGVLVHAQINPQMAQSLQKSLDSVCTLYNIKGATAAVLVPGQGIWEGTHGISKPNEPVNKSMAFGMGSNTKTYIAALLLKLQQAGKLSLNDTIGKWIQGYPNIPGSVTIKQCLNHTTGIAEYLSAAVNDSLLQNPPKIWTLQEMLTTVKEPNFAPGTSTSHARMDFRFSRI
jgi:D-alanyl-D-alanine carboxypeptidase